MSQIGRTMVIGSVSLTMFSVIMIVHATFMIVSLHYYHLHHYYLLHHYCSHPFHRLHSAVNIINITVTIVNDPNYPLHHDQNVTITRTIIKSLLENIGQDQNTPDRGHVNC